jgi:hypothetical protein
MRYDSNPSKEIIIEKAGISEAKEPNRKELGCGQKVVIRNRSDKNQLQHH